MNESQQTKDKKKSSNPLMLLRCKPTLVKNQAVIKWSVTELNSINEKLNTLISLTQDLQRRLVVVEKPKEEPKKDITP